MKKFSSLLLTAFVCFALVTPVANAATVAELEAELKSLFARIAELTSQLPNTTAQDAVSSNAQRRICLLMARNLGPGLRGDDVSGLQEFLRDEGYLSATPTGYFGSLTEEALGRWQLKEGVVASDSRAIGWGYFGPMTRARIAHWCKGNTGPGNAGDLSASPTRGTAPLAVTFSARVSLAGTGVQDAGMYKIEFGDGTEHKLTCTAHENCPGPHTVSHTYSSNGTYNAKLTHYGYFPGPNMPNSRTVGTAKVVVGDAPVACTLEYAPVCGRPNFTCPANAQCQQAIPITYGNRCALNAAGATFLYNGPCQGSATTTSGAPSITSFSGPTTLEVNQTGTWTIQASDPEGGALTYKISWGDSASSPLAALAELANDVFVQTTTFTHAYAQAGIYTIKMIVKDITNKETQTTTTVKVGSGISSGCVSGGVTYPEGTRRISIVNADGSTLGVADGEYVCRSGQWKIESTYPGPNPFVGCWSGGVWYAEGTQRTSITSASGENSGVADAFYVCRSGVWKIEGGVQGTVCTTQYAPVCGRKAASSCLAPGTFGVVSQQCDAQGTLQTYSNSCYMQAAGASFVHNGVCGSTPEGSFAPSVGSQYQDAPASCRLSSGFYKTHGTVATRCDAFGTFSVSSQSCGLEASNTYVYCQNGTWR